MVLNEVMFVTLVRLHICVMCLTFELLVQWHIKATLIFLSYVFLGSGHYNTALEILSKSLILHQLNESCKIHNSVHVSHDMKCCIPVTIYLKYYCIIGITKGYNKIYLLF